MSGLEKSNFRLDFVCVGAQKAGTTSLHDTLAQHPHIFLPKKKETFFFQSDEQYAKGISFYENEYFQERGTAALCGEIDPRYLYYKKVPERLSRLPNASDLKIIFLLRNPANRAFSQFLMEKNRGTDDISSFAEALEREAKRAAKDDYGYLHHAYLQWGMYAQHIKEYLKYFPKSNMLFISFENEFVKKQEETIHRVCEFIGADTSAPLAPAVKSNTAVVAKYQWLNHLTKRQEDTPPLWARAAKAIIPKKMRRGMKQQLRQLNDDKNALKKIPAETHNQLIHQYFKEDIDELEGITGLDFSHWRVPKVT